MGLWSGAFGSVKGLGKFPGPREDPKSRSLKGVPIKYPLVARVPNWGIYFLDPPGGLGLGWLKLERSGV